MNNDLIRRQDAIDSLEEERCPCESDYDKGYLSMLDKAIWIIQQWLPSAQPERKRGRWKRHNTYRGDDTSGYVDPDWRCSECGKRANINEYFMYDLTDFCPNCGADMRGDYDEKPM